MGQKVHPKLFRLGISQKHLSTWYIAKLKYAQTIKEDYLIRNKIYSLLSSFFTISEIHIARIISPLKNNTCIHISISGQLAEHKLLYKKANEIFNVSNEVIKRNGTKSISKLIQYELRYLIRLLQYLYKANIYISLKFIESPYDDATLLAKHIGSQLQKRIPTQRILKTIFKQIKFMPSIIGLKIQISGRLNKQELARIEWKREGTIPLHTLKAKIDYALYPAKTADGILGVKIWLYKNK